MIPLRMRQDPAYVAAHAPRSARSSGRRPLPDPPPWYAPWNTQGRAYTVLPDGSWLVIPLAEYGLTGASQGDDAVNINNCLFWAAQPTNSATPAGVVRLVPGATYTTYTPITGPASPAAPTLDGGIWWQGTANDFPSFPATSAGTVIKPDSSFTGAAVIQQTTTSATYIPGISLRNFTIEANALPAASGIHGILLQGAVATGSIQGVMVHRPDGDCLHVVTDPTSGKWPDDWFVFASKFSSSRSSRGVYLNRCNDITVVSCEASENFLDQWYIADCGNSKFDSCKGENSAAGQGGAGFHLAGSVAGNEGPTQLVNCGTQFNDADGYLFTGGMAPYNVLLTGCKSSVDGRNNGSGGGGFAGFRASGFAGRVVATGCLTYADGTGPQYGASEVSASFGTCYTGCYLAGVTAATHDDATNTHALVSQSPVPF